MGWKKAAKIDLIAAPGSQSPVYVPFPVQHESRLMLVELRDDKNNRNWAREAEAPEADGTKIANAFKTAVEKGLRWSRLRLSEFVFSMGRAKTAKTLVRSM